MSQNQTSGSSVIAEHGQACPNCERLRAGYREILEGESGNRCVSPFTIAREMLAVYEQQTPAKCDHDFSETPDGQMTKLECRKCGFHFWEVPISPY